MKRIILTVAPDGTPKIETKGFLGSCLPGGEQVAGKGPGPGGRATADPGAVHRGAPAGEAVAMQLTIDPAGEARCLYTEAIDLVALGSLTIARASNVEPLPDGRWIADLGLGWRSDPGAVPQALRRACGRKRMAGSEPAVVAPTLASRRLARLGITVPEGETMATVVIYVSGGVVQQVKSDLEDLEVFIADYDNGSEGDELDAQVYADACAIGDELEHDVY